MFISNTIARDEERMSKNTNHCLYFSMKGCSNNTSFSQSGITTITSEKRIVHASTVPNVNSLYIMINSLEASIATQGEHKRAIHAFKDLGVFIVHIAMMETL